MSKTKTPSRSALLVGATGLVGGQVLDRLLGDRRYGRIHVLARRPVGRNNPRLELRIQLFERIEELTANEPDFFAVDDVFCCLGTTMAKAGSKAAFSTIDLDYTTAIARAASENGAKRLFLVSAVGADPRSPFFYNRIKGRTEAAVSGLGFAAVHLIRPSLLLGERREHRPGEALGQRLTPLVSPLLSGPLRRYRPIRAEAVADAIMRLAAEDRRGVHIHHPTLDPL